MLEPKKGEVEKQPSKPGEKDQGSTQPTGKPVEKK
jgi:hypothetical protein